MILNVVFDSSSATCSFRINVNTNERSIDGKVLVDLMFQEVGKSSPIDFGKLIMTEKSLYWKRTVEPGTCSEELHVTRLPLSWLPPQPLNLISRIDGRICHVEVNGNIHFQLQKGIKIQ